MTNTSFFARKTWGQPNYLLVALICAFVLALVPRGAWQALDASATDAEHWLPPSYDQMQDLAWFNQHFRGEQFALVSWDGCTLDDDEQLELLAKKLVPAAPRRATAAKSANASAGTRWYSRVVTGPQVIRQLMTANAGMSYNDAIKRLEGALVGPQPRDSYGRAMGNESRITCAVVYFAPEARANAHNLRAAVNGIARIAATECGIDPGAIHMGGPPVDEATIDAESGRTLLRLAPLAATLGLALCYWRLKSVRLTALVCGVGAMCAALSLAIVFYFGVFEVLVWSRETPQWGALEAILMAMPAIVFMLAVSASLHAANYYFEARRSQGLAGAAESAFRLGLRPTLLAALAAAAAMAAMATSDIVPMQKFGVFTAFSLIAMVGAIYAIMPMVLHRFPLDAAAIERRTARTAGSRLTLGSRSLVGWLAARGPATLACWVVLLAVLGAGLLRIDAEVKVLNMLHRDSDLIQDYAWLEKHLGNLVPMEVVLTMPPERLRMVDEHAEADGQQYRLTMLERLELLRQIQRRLEAFPQISRALSAATFAPAATETGLRGANRGGDYAKNKALEYHRDQLLAGDYLRLERERESHRLTGRELWRLNARIAAAPGGAGPADYSVFLEQVTRSLEPVLLSYQQRDQIVRAMHEQGKQLAGSRVCVLFRAPNQAAAPPAEVQEHALAGLLATSGVAPRGVTYFNIAAFEHPGRATAAQDAEYRASALASLQKQDAVILASAPSDPVVRQIAENGVYIVNVTNVHSVAETAARALADDGGPRPIRAVVTGLAPVVERTQRQLVGDLGQALGWAIVLAASVVTLGYMSVVSGILAMAPAMFTLAATLGAMGWLGVKIDFGIAMTAAVGVGVAIEGTIHFIHWHRQGLAAGRNRRDAVLWAYDRCGICMIETALIAAAGTAAFALSGFTPIREFGGLMIAMLAAALAGNLLMLPGILASPLGWFFAPAAVRRLDPLWPKIEERLARRRAKRPAAAHGHVLALPHPPQAPHAPHFTGEPSPARRTAPIVGPDERRDMADGPHAALQAKLQKLRRPRTGDSSAT